MAQPGYIGLKPRHAKIQSVAGGRGPSSVVRYVGTPAHLLQKTRPNAGRTLAQNAGSRSAATLRSISNSVLGLKAPDGERPGRNSGSVRSSRRTLPEVREAVLAEIDEEDLVIPEEIAGSHTRRGKSDVPIRLLRCFAIYDLSTGHPVPCEEWHRDLGWGATGYAEVWYDDSDSDFEDAEDGQTDLDFIGATPSQQRVRLTKITDLNFHHVKDSSETSFVLDEHIYIGTDHAWYILDNPAEEYIPYIAPFWIKQRLFHEAVRLALMDGSLTYDAFAEDLYTSELSMRAELLVGRRITPDDLKREDTRAYIVSQFRILNEQAKRSGASSDFRNVLNDLRAVPLFQNLLGPCEQPIRTRLAVHKQHSHTTVTPEVYQIAEKLFPRRHLLCIGDKEPSVGHDVEMQDTHGECQPHDIEMITEWVYAESQDTGDPVYSAVMIDGEVFKVGDVVRVERGKDWNTIRETNASSAYSRSDNAIANESWFIKICYMYEEPLEVPNRPGAVYMEKRFHGQWFQHGSQLLFQETAHSHGLYLINECSDVKIDSIVRKCHMHELDLRQDEAAFEPCHDMCFFTPAGLIWNQTDVVFQQLRPHEIDEASRACPPTKCCIPCGLKAVQHERRWEYVSGKDYLVHNDICYHTGDFVYIRPDEAQPALYLIAQIIRIEDDTEDDVYRLLVEARLFERYDTIVRQSRREDAWDIPTDERRLVWTNATRVFDVLRIEGKAFVVHPKVFAASGLDLSEWLTRDDHFFVDFQAPTFPPASLTEIRPLPVHRFSSCDVCVEDRNQTVQDEKNVLGNRPLRCLELFAGAGGLSAGLHKSGVVEPTWAVESSPSAALTYAENHPECIVYTQCANTLLQHAVDTYRGRKPNPLKSLNEKQRMKLPPMPKPGMVDIICGGPPCQGFSGSNRNKKVDDIRTTLVCNMLSYVEFYRPTYVLMENVRGMMGYRLNGRQEGYAIVGGIGMGVVKFIFRTLVSLGYQVHCKVLQAAQYGSPQGRERVIFWAAKRTVPLPDFPVPTHHFPNGAVNFKLPTGEILHKASRGHREEWARREQYAPLGTVTVMDAIGDLPKFDWYHEEAQDGFTILQRKKEGIYSFGAAINDLYSDDYVGWKSAVSYASEPMNRFQREMRESSEKVNYHYTEKYQAKSVELVINIPLRPGANHEDLPTRLRIRTNFKKKNESDSHYKRLDGNKTFRTILTSMNPQRHVVIHPTQKRVLTVRERARAQGFPDSYRFLSVHTVQAQVIDDQLRQIGNAVPIQLAHALGKELRKSLVRLHRERELESDANSEASMDIQ